jgi:pyrroline-5-carboxylate reductase
MLQQNSKVNGRTIAVVGPGQMGMAILEGILTGRVAPADQVLVIHRGEKNVKDLVKKHAGIMISNSKENEAVDGCDIIILCVKPVDMPQVFTNLRGRIRPDILVISIAAGVPIRVIAEGLDCRHVVRCMPNTPGSIGAGVTGWTATDISDEHRDCVRQVLRALGEEVFFEKEEYLDIVTGVSGTGTAYILLFMEAMIDAAVREGLSRVDAKKLVFQTVEGTVKLAKESDKHGKHLAELRDDVTSPGGTTSAALYEMEKGGFRTIVANAIRVACERSRELGRMLTEKLRAKEEADKEEEK